MGSGKAQASQSPTALGSMLQASAYGMTIPKIYGLVMSPLLAIWAANIRQGGSGKKGKTASKKGGQPTYVENIDFLLGSNPIMGVNQMWSNSTLYPLNYVKRTFSGVAGASGSFTLTDSHFYAVIAVTLTVPYAANFNDYGAQGASSVSGTYEVPLWNTAFAGPDPVDGSAQRNWPYCYTWIPTSGNTIVIEAYPGGALPSGTVTVYYAQLSSVSKYQSPLARNRLSFEAVLGSGSEYLGTDMSGGLLGFSSGAPFESTDLAVQQILYPWYAGVGSPNIDLGVSGMIPQLKAEVQGMWGIYPTGDCDYVDIIEDILKSGVSQASLGGSLNFGPNQSGLGCYNYPGAIQKKAITSTGVGGSSIAFDLPNSQGNLLIAYYDGVAANGSPAPLSISDALGNAWVKVAGAGRSPSGVYGVWYCLGCAAGSNTVSFIGAPTFSQYMTILEYPAMDVFSGATVVTGGSPLASVAATNASGYAGVLLGIGFQGGVSVAAPGQSNLWPTILPSIFEGHHDGVAFVQQRSIKDPGAYSLSFSSSANSESYLVLLAFAASQPPSYPNPLPDILDAPSRELTRRQCRAGGLWGSLSMNAQKSASDWIKDLTEAANCAPVWSGFSLKLIPLSEVSAAGNGAIYIAPTAAGPVASLTVENGDFICGAGESPIVSTRKARTDIKTVLQLQCLNRTSGYQQVVVAEPDPAGIARYGVRKGDPKVNNAIVDAGVGRSVLRVQVQRANYVEIIDYSFKLNACWGLLESMDVVVITDRQQGIVNLPVRLTSVAEDESFALSCTAEPFIYGVHSPQPLPVTTVAPYNPGQSNLVDAGNVNPPIIFEPVPRQHGLGIGSQLCVVASSAATNYGGCQVFISTDGGASYRALAGPIIGSAITGISIGDWAASADPDSTQDLLLDLTESNGVLENFTVIDQDNFTAPCYLSDAFPVSTPYISVNGGASGIFSSIQIKVNNALVAYSGGFGYELLTYATAVLTAPGKYTLKATGAGNHLRRSVYAASDVTEVSVFTVTSFTVYAGGGGGATGGSGTGFGSHVHSELKRVGYGLVRVSSAYGGPDHPAGSRFAYLAPGAPGVLSVPMDSAWIGQKLYFKVLSFNAMGGALQSLTDVPSYTYTPTGVPSLAATS